MSITAQIARTGPYVMAAFPQACPSGFAFQLSSELLVINAGQVAAPRDPPATLVLGSDYTVTGGGYLPSNQMQTGTVTVNSGGANTCIVGDVIWILRNVPVNQIASATSATLSPILIEEAMDKQAAISQQLVEKSNRALTIEANETLPTTLFLSQRKNSFLSFDLNGSIVYQPLTGYQQPTPIISIAALRSISVVTVATGSMIQLLGYYAPGDGGSGLFYYDSSSVASDNGGTIIAPSSGTGRWLRVIESALNVRWFGAVGDGTTSDQTAFDNAYTFALANNRKLFIPQGTFMATLLVVSSNVTIEGASPKLSTIKQPAATQRTVTDGAITNGSANFSSVTASFSASDIGKTVQVPGAFSGTNLTGKIISITSSVVAVLSNPATSTVSGATCYIGTGRSVIDVGNCYLGNSAPALSNVSISNLTLDGNKSNVAAPQTDVLNHGLSTTNVSQSFFKNIAINNCWNGGVSTVITSNFNQFENITVNNCSNSTYGITGFDVNSSSYNQYKSIIVESSVYGARLLDNCFGNSIDVVAQNCGLVGFLYGNQSVNRSSANVCNVIVRSGCTAAGIQFGGNITSSVLNASIEGCAGYGIQVIDGGNVTSNNVFNLVTRANQFSSAQMQCSRNRISLAAYGDCLTGPAGTYFFCDIRGNENVIDLQVDDPTTNGRGIIFAAATTNNIVNSFKINNSVQPFSNLGATSNKVKWTPGFGGTIASASTIAIPQEGDFFFVSGTTTIGTLSGNYPGRKIVLTFQGVLLLSKGSNLKIASNYNTTADDTITLVSDDTCSFWYELCRSIN